MEPPTPYRDAAATYRAAGWIGVLPIPYGTKRLRKTGWTGHDGAWPSTADIQAWADNPAADEGGGNIALRLPRDVIGIDVDNYAGKHGQATLAEAASRWGELPPTWTSTARGDGPSRIYLYRVPEGLRWPGELTGGHVEIIQTAHRYALVWPSLNPETGTPYRWYTPDSIPSTRPPHPDELHELPDTWLVGLTGGEMAEPVRRADLSAQEYAAWIVGHGAGQPCGALATIRDRLLHELTTGSAHESLRRLMGLVRLAEQGHPGLLTALGEVRAAFLHETTRGDRAGATRDLRDAENEWRRSLDGATSRVLGNPSVADGPHPDPCDTPFAGLIAPQAAPEPAPGQNPPPAQHDSPAGQPEGDVSAAASADAGASSTLEEIRARLVATELAQLRVRREARRLLDEEEARAQFREPVWRKTLTDELAIPDEPVAYTIDQVMPTGANVLLTAQYKTGKTTLVNSLARALADGDPWLGHFKTNELPGRIALWNYEVDERQYRRWLRELGIRNTDSVSVLNLRGYRMPLISRWVEDWVVAWLVEHEIGIWFVDPFARAFVGSGESENNNTEVGTFLDTLDVIKCRAGVSDLVMPTHTGREQQEEGQERARGATRLDDWADVRWLLTRDNEDTRYFRATGRDVDIPETALGYNSMTRALTIGNGGSRKQKKREPVQSAIMDAIRSCPGISTRDLRAAAREHLGAVGAKEFTEAYDALRSGGRFRVVPGKGPKPSQHFETSFSDLVEVD